MGFILVLFRFPWFFFFFFFNDTATTEIYTLSLHDALPISAWWSSARTRPPVPWARPRRRDRKSTRLNSSHVESSYAVFCLKKKKKTESELSNEKKKKNKKIKKKKKKTK